MRFRVIDLHIREAPHLGQLVEMRPGGRVHLSAGDIQDRHLREFRHMLHFGVADRQPDERELIELLQRDRNDLEMVNSKVRERYP